MDFHPKLVAFDLDGTLAESKMRVSSDVGELLARLMQKMPVAVMSGAAFHQFESQFLPALPLEAKLERLYLFPTNAAQCYAHQEGAWVLEYDESFSEEEKQKIHGALAEALVEVNFEQPAQLWGEQVEDRGAQITFSALGQEAPVEEKKKWDPTRQKRMPLWQLLVEKLPEFSVGLNATTSIDITRKGVTKAFGVRKLSELTGILIAEMLYVGDALSEGGNDAVVKETGIRTHEVFGPKEIAALIEDILQSRAQALA